VKTALNWLVAGLIFATGLLYVVFSLPFIALDEFINRWRRR
jgi:hypothetical protein